MSNNKYCDQCGQPINKESKFCASCGFKIKNQPPVIENIQEIKNTNHLKKEQKNKILTKEEKLEKENAENKADMSRQVNEYDTLSITQSVRGRTVLFMGGVFIISLILGIFGILVKPLDVVIEAVIYIPILLFIFYGHRWASVVLMVLWTIDKIYMLITATDYIKPNIGLLLSTFAFWAYVINLSLKNIEIENLRIKNKEFLEEGNSFVYEKDLVNPKDYFCSSCNIHYSSENEVCPQCNNEAGKEMDSKKSNNDFKIGDFKPIIIGVIGVMAIFLLISKFSFSDNKVSSKDNETFSASENNVLDIKELSGTIASVNKNNGTINEKEVSCDKSKAEFQTTLDSNKREAEKVGIYKNVSIIKEIFYSSKIKTCVAVVEILNDHQSPPERRMYAYDTLNDKDLFSTGSYYCNYENSCSNPAYSVEKNNFYDKVGNLGGTVLKENIPRLTSIIKKNTITVINNVYGTIETFEINYQDGSVVRNEIPGFVYNQDRVKKYQRSDCTIVDINLWRCGNWDKDTFGVKDGKYFWYISGVDFSKNFTLLK